MKKKYVLFTDKKSGEKRKFATIVQMYKELGEKKIGITKNSLWNAWSKNLGIYENERIKVEKKYKTVSILK